VEAGLVAVVDLIRMEASVEVLALVGALQALILAWHYQAEQLL
jgi:hypothetical protein